MNRQLWLVAAILIVLLSSYSNLQAGTLPSLPALFSAGVDGEQVTLQPVYDPNALGEGQGAYIIDGYQYQTPTGPEGDGGSINLSGYMDPDPTVLFSGAVVDFGAPSNFTFTFILPLAPLVSNPSVVFDTLSGSATDSGNNGVTLTPILPPAGISEDGDGVPEIQVFSLSSNGGATWQNVDLDEGPAAVFPGGAISATYGPFAEGPIPTIPGGPWTHMRADISFRLSGFGDAFTFSGRKDLLAVPEPGTLVLSAFSLIAFFVSRRRFDR